jgi:hypothetical protein
MRGGRLVPTQGSGASPHGAPPPSSLALRRVVVCAPMAPILAREPILASRRARVGRTLRRGVAATAARRVAPVVPAAARAVRPAAPAEAREGPDARPRRRRRAPARRTGRSATTPREQDKARRTAGASVDPGSATADAVPGRPPTTSTRLSASRSFSPPARAIPSRASAGTRSRSLVGAMGAYRSRTSTRARASARRGARPSRHPMPRRRPGASTCMSSMAAPMAARSSLVSAPHAGFDTPPSAVTRRR